MPELPNHVPTCGQTEVLTMDYCARCRRVTVRIVFENGRQLCLGHDRRAMTQKQIAAAERRVAEARQPRLF